METKPIPTAELLGQMFDNNSDCYADTRIDHGDHYSEGLVIQAMTKEKFIAIAHEYAVLFAKHHRKEMIEAIGEMLYKDYDGIRDKDSLLIDLENPYREERIV